MSCCGGGDERPKDENDYGKLIQKIFEPNAGEVFQCKKTVLIKFHKTSQLIEPLKKKSQKLTLFKIEINIDY